MKKVKIVIATHKKFETYVDDPIYIPIQVGAALHKNVRLGYLCDDTNDNISIKNNNYCELTAVYWAWKNIKCDIIGLCHYRRYFFTYGIKNKKNVLVESDIIRLLKKSDAIISYPLTHKGVSNWDFYCKGAGREKDLRELKKVLQLKYNEYIPAFDCIMNQDYASYYNMIMTKKDVFDNYTTWLFDVFNELEEKIDMTGYSIAEQRIYGYMSELLLNVWLKHNQIKIEYRPVKLIDENLNENSINSNYLFQVIDKIRHIRFSLKHKL